MFEQFFGLSENPFSLTPDPRFIYPSRTHDEALAHLKYWLEHKEGFALITGEVGTGKTTALFRLIDGLERRYEIAFLTNSTLSPVELLEDVCRKFGIDVDSGVTKPALLQKLENYLRRQVDRQSGTLLIIDEAQNFDHPLLEEVRLLSNIAKPGGPPMLQIALVGQPELERKLASPELRQLKQRIGVHYRIEPLSPEETLHYVHHRVSVAGGFPRVLFPEDTLRILHDTTHGLPREINQLASQSLLGAYVEDSTTVRPAHIQGAIREMNFRSVLDGAERPGTVVSAAMAAPPPPRTAPQPPHAAPQTAAPPPPRAVPPPPAPVVATPPRPAPPPVVPVAPASPVRPSAPPPIEMTPVPPAPPRPVPVAVPLTSRPESPEATVSRPAPAPPHPPGQVPASDRRRARPVSSFGAVPPLSSPRAEVESAERVNGWRRVLFGVGALALLGTIGYLVLLPHPEPVDELAEVEAEQTIPTAPTSVPGVGLGTVPNPRQSAGASGTALAPGESLAAPAGLSASGSALQDSARPTTASPSPSATDGSSEPAPRETAAPPATPPAAPTRTEAEAIAPATGYRLQVASLVDSMTAVTMGRDLARRTGLGYEIVRDRKGDVTWFALNMGSFESEAAARATRAELGERFRVMAEAIIREPRRR
jgi:type II secretory pathway predicted ATPase ExeA